MNKTLYLTGSQPFLTTQKVNEYFIFTSLNVFFYIPRCCSLTWNIWFVVLLTVQSLSLQLLFSPGKKRIAVWHRDVRFGDLTVLLPGNLGICIASLSWSRLLCVKEDVEGEKETTFRGEVMQRILSNLQFDLQGRQGVPGVGLWRENRAQAWGFLLWLPWVKPFFVEERTLSPLGKG